jgi:hypothetical protein
MEKKLNKTMEKPLNETVGFGAPGAALTPSPTTVFQVALGAGARRLGWRRYCSIIVCLFLMLTSAHAKNWYVDNAATGANNGTSWANAWRNVKAVTGVQPGDTVFISGGTNSKTYSDGGWIPLGGVKDNPVTYKVGQDPGHNGIVRFNGGGAAQWLFAGGNKKFAWVTIDGNYGGECHITVDNYTNAVMVDAGATGLTLRYIKSPLQFRAYKCDYMEYDHLILGPTMGIDRQIVGLGGSGIAPAYSHNLIRDCIIYTYYQHNVNSQGGNGDDAMANITSTTVKNCQFIGVFAQSYTKGQHADGIQAADWVWADGCYFENPANYGVYFEFFGNGGNNRVTNSVFNYTDRQLARQPSQAIAIGSHDSASTVSNVLVANNTVYGGKIGIALGIGSQQALSGCAIVNNITVSNDGIRARTGQGSGLQMLSNKAIGGSIAPPNTRPPANSNPVIFVSAANKDFHLATSDTGAKYAGTSWPSAYFNIDKDGKARPQGSAWSLGAYEYGSGGDVVAGKLSAPQNLRVVPGS